MVPVPGRHTRPRSQVDGRCRLQGEVLGAAAGEPFGSAYSTRRGRRRVHQVQGADVTSPAGSATGEAMIHMNSGRRDSGEQQLR
jgi:hypothetical protein